MTPRRLAAAGAGVLLLVAAAVVWRVSGVGGLLLVLAALVIGLLLLAGALLARVGQTLRETTSMRREVGAVATSLARLAERQMSSDEVRQAVAPTVEVIYSQLEGLLSLHTTLSPQRPLPPLRGEWAVSPDFMTRAVSIVLDRRTTTIVECGSGSSTVYLALALRRVGGGRLVALEHKEQFAEATRDQLAEHGLADVATVCHAPLRPVTIEGAEWLWYDLAALPEVDGCGLLIVDGPPRTVQDLARYPALPLLRDRLLPGALILMDDYRRKSERRTVRRWMAEYPQLELRVHDHEKRTAELRLPGG